MKKYFNHRIKKAVEVQSLITIEALELSPAFSYPKEIHEFYEFAYVERGNLSCTLGEKTVELSGGDFLLIPPAQTHSYSVDATHTASIFIVCFRCSSELLKIFDRKIALRREERGLIAEIVKEAKNAFSFPFKRKLRQLESPLFGAQQLVENNIERLLIALVRNETVKNENIKLVRSSEELERNLVQDVLALLESGVYGKITLEDISRQTYYSKTFLNGIFKKHMCYTIMQYYSLLKVKEAKKLLRENRSPSVVSHQLHFESPTYFTKVFKKYAGLTPTAYKKTAE
jgi:AraC-like DNA-binding protein